MAQRMIVRLIDDIDGSEAVETLTFAVDGVTYEIDLNQDHADELRDTLTRWTRAGRRTSRTATSAGGVRRRAARGAGSAGRRGDLDAVRAWARDNGYQVSDRGRVAAAVLEAYDQAH